MAENAPVQTFKVVPLAALLVASCLFGSAFGYGLAAMAVWGDGTAETLIRAAGAAAVTWLIAAGAGIGLLLATTGLRTDRLALPALASSVMRMLVALTVGLLLYFVLKVEGRTYWTSFLASGICCLLAETAWAMRALGSLTPATAHSSGVSSGVSECS